MQCDKGYTSIDSMGLRGARTVDVVGLLRACLVTLAFATNAADVYLPPGPPLWSMAQAMVRIRGLLPELVEAGGDLAVFLPRVAVDVPDRERRWPALTSQDSNWPATASSA